MSNAGLTKGDFMIDKYTNKILNTLDTLDTFMILTCDALLLIAPNNEVM